MGKHNIKFHEFISDLNRFWLECTYKDGSRNKKIKITINNLKIPEEERQDPNHKDSAHYKISNLDILDIPAYSKDGWITFPFQQLVKYTTSED